MILVKSCDSISVRVVVKEFFVKKLEKSKILIAILNIGVLWSDFRVLRFFLGVFKVSRVLFKIWVAVFDNQVQYF